MQVMFRPILFIAVLHLLASCGGGNYNRSYIISESAEKEAVAPPIEKL